MRSSKSIRWLLCASTVLFVGSANAPGELPASAAGNILAVTPLQVGPDALAYCQEMAFSTEEDFITQGPEPPDGNPIISDGDLLGPGCAVCARNLDLLGVFDVTEDLGLDAADVVSTQDYRVAFSTELDSPNAGQFTAGDLLVTNGAVIPNVALTAYFNAGTDLGLDAVHFIGDPADILQFLTFATGKTRSDWLSQPTDLPESLARYDIDIWFSTEGTLGPESAPVFLDGDLLSARYGAIVEPNYDLLPLSVPAGIPTRGVDFGLDAVAADRSGGQIQFSTEILYDGEPGFSDGDLLNFGDGVATTNAELVLCFEPRAEFLGLDAFSVAGAQQQGATEAVTYDNQTQTTGDPAPMGVGQAALQACQEKAFSTEEDFVTNGTEPPDGNPIISDGDLFGADCAVCARNADLLQSFDVSIDLGLDAADVIDVDTYIVAFSTELDSPNFGQFTSGDLLLTNSCVIPNVALTYALGVSYDLGLDGIHFLGATDDILAFVSEAQSYSRDDWLSNPANLAQLLSAYNVDIWFSTEGTGPTVAAPQLLDGDVLSARDGIIVKSSQELLPPDVPAGIPSRGVDFGLDAVTCNRLSPEGSVLFSTEILYDGETSFTDGDVLLAGAGVLMSNHSLVLCFAPKDEAFLGLDAISMPDLSPADKELGDAPDSTNHHGKTMYAYPGITAHFPTVFDTATGLPPGPAHLNIDFSGTGFWLGPWKSLEHDADLPLDKDIVTNIDPDLDAANRDGSDDGVLFEMGFSTEHCVPTYFNVQVTIASGAPTTSRYINVWFDWNRDGDWDDTFTCNQTNDAPEWAVQNYVFTLGPGTYVLQTPAFIPFNGPNSPIEAVWMRISVADEPAPAPQDGRGPADGYAFGETEDYFLPRPCDQCGDFDASGTVNFADLKVLTDNWLWEGMPGGYNDADLDCNGRVTLRDYAILASQWLDACP